MNRYQGNSHGPRDSGGHQVNSKDYSSSEPDPANNSRPFTQNAQYHRSGTPQDIRWDSVSIPYSCMSSFEGTSKCTHCITLDCELRHTRNCLKELSAMILDKSLQLDKSQSDLFSCNQELNSSCAKIQKMEEQASSCNEELSLSYKKIQHLEESKKEFIEEFSHLKKQCTGLEQRCADLEKLVEEKEELIKSHQIYSCAPVFIKVSDAQSGSLDSSWEHESSSKHSSGPPNRHGASGSRDRPFQKSHQGDQSDSNQSHPIKKESNDGRCWNSRDVPPNRPQSSSTYPQDRQPNPSLMNRAQGTSAPYERKAGNNVPLPNLVKELKSDLFEMSPEYALAHCVGSDFIMSSGVAVKFRKKFRSVPELLDQNKKPGQVAFVNKSGQYIYYLVTKLASTGKPKWEDFEKSVAEWKSLCVEHGVKKIAIPKIGCGRDLLDWRDVQNLLNREFADTGIELTVCIIDRESTPEKKWSLTLRHSKEPLSQLDPRDCALVFIASKDLFITPAINRLGMKYGFLPNYRSHKLTMGSLYCYTNQTRKANIYGLVVKERHDDAISFTAISRCLQDLKRVVKKSSLYYMGFEAFDDVKFETVSRKLWTLVIDVFFIEYIEVHFCWPEEVKEKCWEDRD